MNEYIIKGSAFNRASWHYVRTVLPRSAYKTQKIDIGWYKDSRFLISGWSYNERSAKEGCTYSWALGRSASILLSLPKEAVRLTANVKPHLFSKPQSITISVDGKVIGIWNLSNRWEWQERSIVIGADEHRLDVSVVEFIFSQHEDPVEKGERPLTVLFESITLSEIKDKDKG